MTMKHIKTYNELFESQQINEKWYHDFGSWLGFDSAKKGKIKHDMDRINPENDEQVNKLWDSVFPSELKGAVKPAFKKATTEKKLEVLKKASKDPDGIGIPAIDKQGNLAYKPSKNVKWASDSAPLSENLVKRYGESLNEAWYDKVLHWLEMDMGKLGRIGIINDFIKNPKNLENDEKVKKLILNLFSPVFGKKPTYEKLFLKNNTLEDNQNILKQASQDEEFGYLSLTDVKDLVNSKVVYKPYSKSNFVGADSGPLRQ